MAHLKPSTALGVYKSPLHRVYYSSFTFTFGEWASTVVHGMKMKIFDRCCRKNFSPLNAARHLRRCTLYSEFRCSFSRPRWDPTLDPLWGDRYGFDKEFGFGRGVREKRRNWWSDDEDDDDDDEDEDFGVWEEPSAIDWIFKILGAFGWMIPAVLISTMLGTTGSNSLIMALVLPLGQTALSLVMDKLWGGPNTSPDPRPKSRPRSRPRPRPERSPFTGSASGSQKYKGGARGPGTGTRPVNGSYQSRGAANGGNSAKKSGRSGSQFGGWDELDELNSSVPKQGQNRKVEEPKRESSTTAKVSMRKKRERPLFFRLLIAVFPFLGSWTRFLL